MKRFCTLAIFLLNLLTILDIGDTAKIYAQNFAYENGSYWLDDIVVTSDPNEKKCDACGQIFKNEDEFMRHLKSFAACATFYDFGTNDETEGKTAEGICVFCNEPNEQCTCNGVVVTGGRNQGDNGYSSGGSYSSGSDSGSGSSGSGGSSYVDQKLERISKARKFSASNLASAVRKAVEYCKRIYKEKAACNIGVQQAFKYLFNKLDPALKGTANDIYYHMINSSNWVNIAWKESWEYANEGCFIIGVWENSSGPGHIVLLRQSTSNPSIVGDLHVMDTGPNGIGKFKDQRLASIFSRPKRNKIKFYIYVGK